VNSLRQLVIKSESDELKAALIDDGKLIEYFVEQDAHKPTVGNMYKGKIINVLPGMEAAFIDIGLTKNAFLHVDDLLPPAAIPVKSERRSIDQLVRAGQELLVQVMKEPLGTKGARVTTHYSLPGRWLVYMPRADYVGISRKIDDEAERDRLKRIGEELRLEGEGLILRTAAAGKSEEELRQDLQGLRSLWQNIQAQLDSTPAPAELFHELDMLPRLVRDVFTDQVQRCVVSDRKLLTQLTNVLRQYAPQLIDRVVLEEHHDVFEHYQIHDQVSRLFARKIWLDNGGYIVIDHTEALTVIDVNTGKYTGSVDLEQTVFETNMEAAKLIAQIIRLRDIGGMIIADFIDMNKEEHRQAIVQLLDEQMRKDRTKCLIMGWTRLGLLEITRKKIRESVDSRLSVICTHCGGTGRIQTMDV
jgi:ribonuclease G